MDISKTIEIPRNQLSKENIKTIDTVTYRMHQEQPVDLDRMEPPVDWKEDLKNANYGSVEPDQVNVEKVRSLLEEITEELNSIDEMEDISVDEFDVGIGLVNTVKSVFPVDTGEKSQGETSEEKPQLDEERQDRVLRLVVKANKWKNDPTMQTQTTRYKIIRSERIKKKRSMEEYKRRIEEMKQQLSDENQVSGMYSELQEMNRRKDDFISTQRSKNDQAKQIQALKRKYDQAFDDILSNQVAKQPRLDLRRELNWIFGRGAKLNEDVIRKKAIEISTLLPSYKREGEQETT